MIAQKDYMKQWPQFRGPYACGIIDSVNLPDKWDINTGENIRWKIEIPGLGHSSPVIWDDKLFITTAISGKGTDSLKVGLYGDIESYDDETIHEFRVICVEKKSGKIVWNKLAHKGVPRTKRHPKASHANATPATNGKYVVAFFGSEGLFCYDFDGELIWKKDFGKLNSAYFRAPDAEWGFASSPIVHENSVIIQCDFLGDSFIASFDIETGAEKWRIPRHDVPTWSTPNYYNKGNVKQIVVNGYKHIGGYDFTTGNEIWKLSGGGDIPVPTPVFAHGLIYIHSAHGKSSPIYAIKPDAKGDISLDSDSTSNEYIVWSIKKGAAYNPTNIIYGKYLYNMKMYGKLSCFDAQTGKLIYQENIPDARGITASAIASNGKIYYCTEQGEVLIIKAGNEFKLIAKNPLDDVIMATPALSDNMLFFRTQNQLIAVGN
ncbi:MAG: PQQ-binding-like beta-propeller repeat protein [Bacteroidetes bacterium]|nr:PQQ-binding-like beta-propeller repeat protein [Bacteroidota bacterium]